MQRRPYANGVSWLRQCACSSLTSHATVLPCVYSSCTLLTLLTRAVAKHGAMPAVVYTELVEPDIDRVYSLGEISLSSMHVSVILKYPL